MRRCRRKQSQTDEGRVENERKTRNESKDLRGRMREEKKRDKRDSVKRIR